MGKQITDRWLNKVQNQSNSQFTRSCFKISFAVLTQLLGNCEKKIHQNFVEKKRQK